MQDTKRIFFPATRFIPDADEKGVIKVNKRGEYLSGIFKLEIFESVKEASVFIVGYSEAVSFNKYLVIREEIEELDVDGVVDYFGLRDEFNEKTGLGVEPPVAPATEQTTVVATVASSPSVTPKDLGNEEESTSEGDQTTGEADGKLGVEAPEQEGSATAKTKAAKDPSK